MAECGASGVHNVLWNTEVMPASLGELQSCCVSRGGEGGTAVSCVAQHIAASGFHGRLVVVTDGQVGGGDVDKASSLLGDGWAFSHVEVHLVGREGEVNLSVPSPFVRASPHVVFHAAPGAAHSSSSWSSSWDSQSSSPSAAPAPAPAVVELSRVSAADLALLGRLDTIGDGPAFEAAFPVLERLVVARTMGLQGDAQLRAALLAMGQRLAAWAAARPGALAAGAVMHHSLVAGNVAGAEAAARMLCVDPLADECHARLQFLLRCTEGALRRVFSLGEIASQRAAFTPATVPVPAVGGLGEAPPLASGAGAAASASSADADGLPPAPAAPAFQCPVTWDDGPGAMGNVVVLLRAAPSGAPLLAGLPKATVDALLDCPLALTSATRRDMAELRASLLGRLDYAVSLQALQGMMAQQQQSHGSSGGGDGGLQSPVTRQPVLAGGLCLGACEAHAAATDATLLRLFCGGKRLGNPDLWFAALVHMVDATGAAPWLHPVLPALRAHLAWRLAHRSSSASLSGLMNMVSTRVPLGAAAWFVVGACAVQDASTPRREAVRAHVGHVDALLWLVGEIGGYPTSESSRRHLCRLRVLLFLLRAAKDASAPGAWAALQADLEALCQASLPLPPRGEDPLLDAVRDREAGMARMGRVLLNGPAGHSGSEAVWAALPPVLRLVSPAEVLALAPLVNPRLSAGDVGLPPAHMMPCGGPIGGGAVLWPPVPEDRERVIPVVAATCRPAYYPGGVLWTALAQTAYKCATGELLPVTRHYMGFVCRYRAFPSAAALMLYMAAKVARAKMGSSGGAGGPMDGGGRWTLPANVQLMVECTLRDHAPLAALGLTPEDAAARYNASAAVADRLRLERGEVPPPKPAPPSAPAPPKPEVQRAGTKRGRGTDAGESGEGGGGSHSSGATGKRGRDPSRDRPRVPQGGGSRRRARHH